MKIFPDWLLNILGDNSDKGIFSAITPDNHVSRELADRLIQSHNAAQAFNASQSQMNAAQSPYNQYNGPGSPMPGANLYRPKPPYHYEIATPLGKKVKVALERTLAELPFRVVTKLDTIRFGPADVTDPRFEVVFKGDKIVEFDNVDTFPTEADIARICLMCP